MSTKSRKRRVLSMFLAVLMVAGIMTPFFGVYNVSAATTSYHNDLILRIVHISRSNNNGAYPQPVIEIFNPTNRRVNLAGWLIHWSGGDPAFMLGLRDATLPPGGSYLLIGTAGADGNRWGTGGGIGAFPGASLGVSADQTFTNAVRGNAAYTASLVNPTGNLVAQVRGRGSNRDVYMNVNFQTSTLQLFADPGSNFNVNNTMFMPRGTAQGSWGPHNPFDRTALLAAIAEAEGLDANDWLPCGWEQLELALNEAVYVVEQTGSSFPIAPFPTAAAGFNNRFRYYTGYDQSDVEAAEAAVRTAIIRLVSVYATPDVGKPQDQWGTFVDDIPNNIGNTFTCDPQTTRTITWQTGTEITSGEVVMGNERFPANTRTIGGRNFHRVDLTGLTPGATYTFVCGTEGAFSREYTFTTKSYYPLPFTILHVTDPQIGATHETADANTWRRTMQAAMDRIPHPAFVVNTGGLVGNSSQVSLDSYFDFAQDILASNAFFYSLGNNDDSSWHNTHFATPANGHNSHSYSFVYGNALFINIDSSDSINDSMISWLRGLLQSRDASIKWTVVMTHESPFGRTAPNSSQSQLTALFDEFGVELVLAGHDRFYARTMPLDSNGNVRERGTVYSIPNAAGNAFSGSAGRPFLAIDRQPNRQMFSAITFSENQLILRAYTVQANGTSVLFDTYYFRETSDDFDESSNTGTANPPMRVTIARGETDTDIRFNWHSDNRATHNPNPSQSVVQIARASDMIGNEFPAHRATTHVGTPTAASAGGTTIANRNVNKVDVSGLDMNTRYVYRVGNGAANGWSANGFFTTGGGRNSSFSFIHTSDAHVGDSNAGNVQWTNTFNSAIERVPDAAFMIHTGDHLERDETDAKYNLFFTGAGVGATQLQQNFRNIPFAPVRGNHGTVGNTAGNRHPLHLMHFNPPTNGTFGQEADNYWFVYGDALIMVIYSQGRDHTTANDPQIQWMRNVVAANPDTTWRILAFHGSLYGVGTDHWNNNNAGRSALIPVIDELEIDLVLQGHDHAYMRSDIMRGDARVTGITTQYINGVAHAVNPQGTLFMNAPGAGTKQYGLASGTFWQRFITDSTRQRRAGIPMFTVIDVTPTTLTIHAYIANTSVLFDSWGILRSDVADLDISDLSYVIEIAVDCYYEHYSPCEYAHYEDSDYDCELYNPYECAYHENYSYDCEYHNPCESEEYSEPHYVITTEPDIMVECEELICEELMSEDYTTVSVAT